MGAAAKDNFTKTWAAATVCTGVLAGASWVFGGQAYDDAKLAFARAQDNARAAATSTFNSKIAPKLDETIVVQRQRAVQPQPMDDALLFDCLDDQMQNSIVVERNVGRSATAGHFPINRPQLKQCFVTSVINNDLAVSAAETDKLGKATVFMAGTAVSLSLFAMSGLMTWVAVQSSSRRRPAGPEPANNI